MRPTRLRARNLRTWETLDITIPAGVTAVVGDNGAGKSSLVTVIDLALFGGGAELRRALSRGTGADTVEVAVDFEHEGKAYRVRRSFTSRGSGKTRLDFEETERVDVTGLGSPWPEIAEAVHSLTRETIAETEADLERLLGITRQTFRASSYLAQGDGDAFTSAQPRDRKAILLDALGVQLWDRLHEKAAEQRRQREAEAGRLLAIVEQLEGQLALRDASLGELRAAEQEVEPLALAVADLEAGIEQRRAEVADAAALEEKFKAARERYEQAKSRVADSQRRASVLQVDIATAEGRLAARTEHEAQAAWMPQLDRMQELAAAKATLRAQAVHLDTLAGQHREREAQATRLADEFVAGVATRGQALADFDEELPVCPTCGQELESGAAIEQAREALTKSLHEAEQARDAAFEQAVAAAKLGRAAEQEHAKAERAADEAARSWQEVLDGLPEMARANLWAHDVAKKSATILATLDEVAEQLERNREALKATLVTLANTVNDRDAAEAAAQELTQRIPLDQARQRLDAAVRDLAGKQAAKRAAEERVIRAEAELDRLDEVHAYLEVQRGVLDELRGALRVTALAEKATGRDGIPALILETSAIPQLETEASRIIGELGRAYRFELRTQRATQAGTVREVLDIVVHTDTGEAAYEDFSGGERTRIDLALRIALARLLATRRGSDVRLLTIDEPAYLDDEGIGRLASVLRDLAGEFESVLVVSHVDTLRDAFDQALTVTGGGDSGEPSRIEGGS